MYPDSEVRKGRKKRVTEVVRLNKAVKAADGKSYTDEESRRYRGRRAGKRLPYLTLDGIHGPKTHTGGCRGKKTLYGKVSNWTPMLEEEVSDATEKVTSSPKD